MRRSIPFLATACALVATSAAPFSGAGGDPRSTPPDWAARPDPEGVSRVYPELANDLSVGGHVTLSCRIDSRGLVERCRVAAEMPAGFKFGAAAMRLTPMFRFRPAMTITGPTPAMINIPIRFVPPPDDIRRAIPFAALLAAFTTALRWYRGRGARRVAAAMDGSAPATN